jgi:heme exporter protein A
MKLALDSVVIERGERALFAPLSFAIASGTLLHVRGANGAGKTSLLRALAGLGSRSGGSVSWLHYDHPISASAAATFVGHANALNDALTADENLSYAASMADLDPTVTAIHSALDQFGVKDLARRRIATLSQGQRKRIALSRLLLRKQPGARAWLLDEPFVALDAQTQATLERLIAIELSAGAIVVLTSHQPFAIQAANVQEISL